MHEVMAAMTTAPWSSWKLEPSSSVHADRLTRAVADLADVAAAHRRVGRLVFECCSGIARRERLVGRLVGTAVLELRLTRVIAQHGAERRLCRRERHPVLRALRTGDRGLDGGQVELEGLGVARLAARVVPEALLLRVRLDEGHLLFGAAGEAQVGQGLVVDREDGARRAVLGAHVADGRAVGQRDGRHAIAVELDERADDALAAQHLGDGEHQVGRGGAGRALARST